MSIFMLTEFSILKQMKEKTSVFLNISQGRISKKPFHLLFQIERVKSSDVLAYLLNITLPLLLQYLSINREDGDDSALNHCINLSNISCLFNSTD